MSSASSTSSVTTTTTTNVISTPSSLPAQFLSIKLTRDNYLSSQAQVLPYMHAQSMLLFVDPQAEVPPKEITVTTTNGASQAPNPVYTAWYQQDQVVLSALLASLTEETIGHVLFLSSASEVWQQLKAIYGARSQARVMQV
jgi:hypothetical protein